MIVVTEDIDGCAYHKVTGECSCLDIIEYIKQNSKEWTSLNSLWDLTESTFILDIPNYNLLKAKLEEIKDVFKGRAGKKSAFVVYDDAVFATIRMAITAGELIEETFSMCVFRGIAESLEWLNN